MIINPVYQIIAFAANPIIGIEIRCHILDLICRRHPIAMLDHT